MPYDIRKVEDGYKVCKKGTKKCYSKDPIPLKRAIAQRKAIGMRGGDYFDDEDWEKIFKGNVEEEDVFDKIRDLPDNKEHFAIDEEYTGGDIDWWGIAKDVGSDLYKQGKDFITQLGETEEQKQARIKKEEACKLCKEGSGISANSGFYRTDPKRLSGGAIPIDKDKYEKAKEIVYPRYKKPSAYRSGAVIKKYKELGGRFKEDGERKLQRWFEEEWKDIGDKNYPVYRPTKRVNINTPLTESEIDPKNLKNQISEKQKIKGEKNLKPFKKKGGFKCPITGKEICECKGGALYAKDKYITGEKKLTETEKKEIKQEMGEGNPKVAEVVADPMGDDDIRKYFPNAKILKYSELKNYSNITELLPKPKTFFFLLYERTPNVGHWVVVLRYKDNGIDTIEFFCSYGSKIDAPLSWTPIGMRIQLGADKPYLSMLLDKSPFRVIYNPVQYQSKRSKIATCGAYDTLRVAELMRHNTTLDEFTEMLKDVKEATGLNYDEIVANLVDMR